MSQQGILFTMPIVAVIDNLGVIATGGSIQFFRAANHATPKLVYQDAALTVPWGSTITLNSIGEQPSNNLIYLSPDEPYFVQFFDQYGTVLKQFDNYPYPSSNTPVVPDQNIQNYVQNPSFAYVYPLPANFPSGSTPLAPGNWSYVRSNTSSTLALNFQPFAAGQNTVPGNPANYLHYVCSVPGSGETANTVVIEQFDNAETFSNQAMAADIYLRSATNSSVELQVIQYFGEGGSPTVTTSIETYTLSPNFTEQNSLFTVPDVTGKTIGPGSYIQFALAYPTNSVATIDLGVSAIYESTKVIDYQEVPSNVIGTQSLQSQFPLISTNQISENFNPADGCFIPFLQKGSTQWSFQSFAGLIVDIGFAYTTGLPYLHCDASSIFSADYYNLVNKITTNWGIGNAGFYSTSTNGVTLTTTATGVAAAGAQDVNTNMKVYTAIAGAVGVSQVVQLLCLPGANIRNSSYFFISNTTTNFYIWFNLNGTGVDPAIGGRTGIPIAYTGSETAAQIAALIAAASITGTTTNVPTNTITVINTTNGNVSSAGAGTSGLTVTQTQSGSGSTQAQVTIQAVAGANIIAGSYLTLNGVGQGYYLWFSQNNGSVDPGTLAALTGLKGIKVIYTGSETIAQMCALMAQQLINAQVLLPAPAALFRRTVANASTNDPDVTTRTAVATGANAGNNVGSYQADQFGSHSHQEAGGTSGGGQNLVQRSTSQQQETPTDSYTLNTGGNQTNPRNIYVDTVILY